MSNIAARELRAVDDIDNFSGEVLDEMSTRVGARGLHEQTPPNSSNRPHKLAIVAGVSLLTGAVVGLVLLVVIACNSGSGEDKAVVDVRPTPTSGPSDGANPKADPKPPSSEDGDGPPSPAHPPEAPQKYSLALASLDSNVGVKLQGDGAAATLHFEKSFRDLNQPMTSELWVREHAKTFLNGLSRTEQQARDELWFIVPNTSPQIFNGDALETFARMPTTALLQFLCPYLEPSELDPKVVPLCTGAVGLADAAKWIPRQQHGEGITASDRVLMQKFLESVREEGRKNRTGENRNSGAKCLVQVESHSFIPWVLSPYSRFLTVPPPGLVEGTEDVDEDRTALFIVDLAQVFVGDNRDKFQEGRWEVHQNTNRCSETRRMVNVKKGDEGGAGGQDVVIMN